MEILNEPIWHNKFILINNTTAYFKHWDNNGISIIGSLLGDNGKFKTLEELNRIHNININIMELNSVKSAIPSKWIKQVKNKHIIKHKLNGHKIMIMLNETGKCLEDSKCKDYYQAIVKVKKQPLTVIKKWEILYPQQIFDWKSIFQIPYIVARETHLQSFQYKLMNRYLACKVNLYRWNKALNTFCKDCQEEETIDHLIYTCPRLQHFWDTLFVWLMNIYGVRINLSVLEIMLGIINENDDEVLHVFNFCILFAKCYIYNCKVNNDIYLFQSFKQTLINRLEVEKCIAISNNNLNSFIQRWNNVLEG